MLFQMIAVIIMLAFYGCYFFKMLSQRKKNIKTDLLGKGKPGFVKFIEITLKFITYTLPVGEIVAIVMNDNPAHISLKIIGAALGVLGVVIFILSVIQMKDSWRAGVPERAETELITSGIYRYSRNPAFLGFDLVYLGILYMFFNWWLCFLTAAGAVMLHMQIVNVEEPFMLDAFGDDYLNYRKKVCRYIGRKN